MRKILPWIPIVGYIAFWFDASLVIDFGKEPMWKQLIVAGMQFSCTLMAALISIHYIITIL